MAKKGVQDAVDQEELLDDEEEAPVEPDESWPDRKQAAAMLNVSTMTLRRLEERGQLQRHKLPGTRGGKIVYDPDQVRELAASSDATPEEMGAQTLVAAAVNLSRQQAQHAERLLQLVEEPAHELLSLMTEENRRLRERVAQMEADRTELFKMMEDARSQEHERQLEQLKWAAKSERQDAMLKFVFENGPRLTQQIVASGQGPAMLTSLSELAQSLTPDQVGSLMGILNPKQAETLGKVLSTVAEEKPTVETKGTHSLLAE